MIISYHMLRIIEVIVTMVAATGLLTCPYEMRWNGKRAKILFGVFWTLVALFPIVNGFYCKSSTVEYVIVSCLTLLIVYIFYQIPILYNLAINLFFWGTLHVIHVGILIITSNQMGYESVEAYNRDFSRVCVMELAECIIVSVLILFLWERKKPILLLQRRKEYIAAICYALVVWSMFIIILPFDRIEVERDWKDSRIAVLAIVLVIVICVFYAMYMYWKEEKRTRQLLQLKDRMLEEQIACLEENYELKRKQVHDNIQQNLLLKGYLQQGKVEEAYQYLEKLQEGLRKTQIKGETGITPIDIMLHYKRERAEMLGIKIVTDIEVYFCPMEHDDICILLGNLLDNAIEAAVELEEEQRKINLKLQTINCMFLLSIENGYRGKRRLWEGKYITTKQKREGHGIGLKSSHQIVRKYGGSFQIKDDGSVFRVEAIVLDAERKEERENESGTETMQCSGKFVAGVSRNG